MRMRIRMKMMMMADGDEDDDEGMDENETGDADDTHAESIAATRYKYSIASTATNMSGHEWNPRHPQSPRLTAWNPACRSGSPRAARSCGRGGWPKDMRARRARPGKSSANLRCWMLVVLAGCLCYTRQYPQHGLPHRSSRDW